MAIEKEMKFSDIKSMTQLAQSVSKDVLALSPELLGPGLPPVRQDAQQVVKPCEEVEILLPPVSAFGETTDEQKLTQVEKDWLVHLRFRYNPDHCRIYVQAFTFKLGHDLRYTPDIVVVTPEGRLIAYECKGAYIWEDSTVKLKAAARMFPFIVFILTQRKKKGQPFIETVIKP